MMSAMIFFAGLFLFFKALGFMSVYRLVVGNAVTLGCGCRVKEADFPQDLYEEYRKTASILEAVGFEFSHLEKRSDTHAAISLPRWVMVLRHEVSKSYAEITTSYLPVAIVPNTVTFISFFEKADIVTRNLAAKTKLDDCPFTLTRMVLTPDLVESFSEHLQWLEELKEADTELGIMQMPSVDDYPGRLKASAMRHYRHLVDSGLLSKNAFGFDINSLPAVSLVQQFMKNHGSVSKFAEKHIQATESTAPVDITVQETDAFLRHRELSSNSRFSNQIKWLIFAASALFFALIIGFAFSWGLVLAVFPVLLVHELGHLLAMRAFGYRDLYLFFMPFGALVMGTKEDRTPWQEAIVLLAGPVPGIILATMTLLFVTEPPDWLMQLCTMSLVINYFNLLPIPPLDGGKLMQLVIFDRHLLLRVLVKVGSIISFGASAFLFVDPIMGFFSVFLLFVALNDFKIWLIQRKMRQKHRDIDNEKEYIQAVFRMLAEKQWLFARKLDVVKQLVNSMPQKLPRTGVAVSIFAVYALAIILPVAVASATSVGGSITENMAVINDDYGSQEYWDKQLTQTTDPKERVPLLLSASYTMEFDDNPAIQHEYLDRAIEESIASEDADLQESAFVALITDRLSRDETALAVDAYEQLVPLVGDKREHLLWATQTMAELKDTELARDYFEKSIDLSKEVNDTSSYIVSYNLWSERALEDGNIDEAARIYEKGVAGLDDESAWQQDVCASSSFANGFLEIGDSPRSQVLLDHCVANGSDYEKAAALGFLAWLKISDSEFAVATELLERADNVQYNAERRNESNDETSRSVFLDFAGYSVIDGSTRNIDAELVLAYRSGDKTRYEEALVSLYENIGTHISKDDAKEIYRDQAEYSSAALDQLIASQVLDVLEAPVLSAALPN